MPVQETTIRVTAEWDGDSRMWTATSEDLPGLVTEGETLEVLIDRIAAVVPDLLDLENASPVRSSIGPVATRRNLRLMVQADREVVVSA
jgi:predicted RNase H-like HicB family nuclease